jgi:hypothetical protein
MKITIWNASISKTGAAKTLGAWMKRDMEKSREKMLNMQSID